MSFASSATPAYTRAYANLLLPRMRSQEFSSCDAFRPLVKRFFWYSEFAHLLHAAYSTLAGFPRNMWDVLPVFATWISGMSCHLQNLGM